MALKIGFSTKYFTLWDVRKEEYYTTDSNGKHWLSGYNWYYTYHQNLSMDEGKAIEKAKDKGCTNLEPDTELYGVRRSFKRYEKVELPPEKFEPYEFHYGKNLKKDIREEEQVGYLKWFYEQDNFHSDDQRAIIMSRAVELRPDWLVIYDDDLITVQHLETIREGKDILKSIKENGWFDYTAKKNCDYEGRLFVGVDIHFPKTRYNEYGGFEYYLPVIEGKQVRIKNKKLRYYISEKIGDFWEISGLQKIK